TERRTISRPARRIVAQSGGHLSQRLSQRTDAESEATVYWLPIGGGIETGRIIMAPGESPGLCPKLFSSPREQFAHRLSGRQAVRAAGLIVDLGRRIDAEAPENRRSQVARRHRIIRRIRAARIACPVHRSAAHSAAGQENRVAIRPVIAPALTVDLRRSS